MRSARWGSVGGLDHAPRQSHLKDKGCGVAARRARIVLGVMGYQGNEDLHVGDTGIFGCLM